VDQISRAALIEGGVYGPSLENQLKPHGVTLRHFPQSFEYSTLGGWIATRSGGHFASLYTHIDDFVESLRVVTPRGILETRVACRDRVPDQAPTACSSARKERSA
jgi:alkyldihydroxyacetonephosphate synthase